MLTNPSVWLVVAVLSPAVAAAQAAARPPAAPQTRPAAPPAAQAPTSSVSGIPIFDPASLTPEYRVAPGDVLQVFVWKEPDLSREIRVRTDGNLTVPLIGDVSAVGKTLRTLASELEERLGQLVTSPVVTVTLSSSNVLRFFVVGQVHRGGEFPLLGRTTVMQALALAGGFQEYAKTDEIRILRQELVVAGGRARTEQVAVPVNYKTLAQGQNLQGDVVLKPGDVIVVP
jgi:polysaccharide export outer membrane protein